MTTRIATPRGRRLLVGGSLVLVFVVGLLYAWTFTPSYALYRIRQALETHDYVTFSRHVDVDSVLDHALDEFVEQERAIGQAPQGPLAKALRKGWFKHLAREAREITKAGLAMAVEQAITDPDRQLPEIPAFAVVGALWQGHREGDFVSFPVKVKKGGRVEVKMRQTTVGTWRVVEVANLSALFSALRSCTASSTPGDK